MATNGGKIEIQAGITGTSRAGTSPVSIMRLTAAGEFSETVIPVNLNSVPSPAA